MRTLQLVAADGERVSPVTGGAAAAVAAPAAPLPRAEVNWAERRGPFRPAKLTSARSRIAGRTLARTFQAVDCGALAAMAVLFGRANDAGGALAAQTLLLAVLLTVTSAYDFRARRSMPMQVLLMAATCAGATAVVVATDAAFGWPGSPVTLGLFGCCAFVGLSMAHALWWTVVERCRAAGKLTPNIVIVGATPSARRLVQSALDGGGAAVLAIFDDRAGRTPPDVLGVPVLGGVDDLVAHRIMPFVDRIVIAVPSAAEGRINGLVERLSPLPNPVQLYLEGQAGDAALSRIADAPLAHLAGAEHRELSALIKRGADLGIGVMASVLLAPVLLLTALAVRLDSPGPVLFRQKRHGFNNETIVVWKFRSMRQETADATASRQVTVGDSRVTRVGRFIRATSLDELPQLWNVLRGEMSLVGPRPHAIGMKTGDEVSERLVAGYAHRHRVKPGVTGWAAINGSRGPVHTPEDVRRRVALDVEYIERQSFWFDLYIMVMTLPRLLGDRGAR